jgi:hypothetical protein
MLYERLFSFLFIVMSTKLILLFCSFSMVNCKFDWMLLNSSSVWLMWVSFWLHIKSTSSTYLKYPII